MEALTVFKVTKCKRCGIMQSFGCGYRKSNDNNKEQPARRQLGLKVYSMINARNVEENIEVLKSSNDSRSQTRHDSVQYEHSTVDAAMF